MSAPAMNIEQRVTVSLALQRYLRAVERFEAASNEFNESCQTIVRHFLVKAASSPTSCISTIW